MTAWSRRGFLQGLLVGGGALALAACGGGGSALRIQHAEQTGELVANLYITVLPTGRVALIVNKAEIGQGVTTGYATLVADELAVPLDHIDVHFAGSNREMRTSSNLQITGGSTSTFEAFVPLRRAAATAREMLIAAAAARWQVPAKDLRAIDGHVVHGDARLAYGELTRSAARMAVPDAPRLKTASEFTLIGKVDRRIDARGKVDGHAKFGIDVQVPGMCHAFAIHGPVFGARPTAVHADAARRRPGVIDVIAFDWGVAVVAEKFWQARAAAAEVEVTWSKGAAAGLHTADLQRAMRGHDGSGPVARRDGDASDALAHAEIRVGGVYEAPYLAHAALEPNNATVSVTGGKAEVWASTQSPSIAQAFVAHAIDIDQDDVKVNVLLCGGGFGRRAIGDACAQAAQISQRVKRPVKLIWTRESDMTQGWYRPVYAAKVEGALRGGKVTGARVHLMSQSIALSGKTLFSAMLSTVPAPLARMVTDAALAVFSTSSFGDVFAAEGINNTPYQLGGFELSTEPVQTQLPVSFWRSVGNSVTGFVMEGLIDELAVAARQDPFALRRALLPGRARQRRVLDALEELAGWATPPPPGIGRGLARHFAFETEVAQVAEVAIVDGRIKVRRVYCVVDCGLAVNPDIVVAQMESAIIFGLSAALDQEITLVDGVVQQRNYDGFPLLRMFECPEIIVKILPSEERPTGVGEPGLPPIAPAVANAIYQLTQVRLRALPLQRAWNAAPRATGGAA
ncbi:MAG TPA: molybdopterin cofactor-binding domain-containing protein [Kofleriaceae bacterium]|nr:molybdopterin cofactor-binding domain-containing protein [Kofleriaceae bacterium]